ncbi:MAG: PepSY-associated TM helix domain-containing protein, partial [Alphaproteobacteria bacterium]|nr:PepSY-associated TM helix domain-containing protein [Alphaproteobacteria bacterium]
SLMQPERWLLSFGGPDRVIQAEYWVGNRSVAVRTVENGFIATLTNLHKGVTMPVAWILLIDTLAGSLIFLSVSGLILWWETNRRRLVGLAIFGVSVAATVTIAML